MNTSELSGIMTATYSDLLSVAMPVAGAATTVYSTALTTPTRIHEGGWYGMLGRPKGISFEKAMNVSQPTKPEGGLAMERERKQNLIWRGEQRVPKEQGKREAKRADVSLNGKTKETLSASVVQRIAFDLTWRADVVSESAKRIVCV